MKKLNIFFLIFASLVASCHHDHEDDNLGYEQVPAPHWTVSNGNAGSVTSVDWKVLESTHNIMSTMTVLGVPPTVEGATTSADDVIGFFAGEECVGVVSPEKQSNGSWRYLLNVYSPKNPETSITLAYFSASQKCVYYWPDCLNFTTDGIVGTSEKPFAVTGRNSNYTLEMPATITLPSAILAKVGAGDEMAVFCGDECRGVLSWDDFNDCFKGNIGMSKETETMTVKYYNASEKRIYTSPEFQASIYDVVIFVSNVNLK